MSWPLVPVGQICEFKYGKSLSASVRDGGELPVYGSNGVVGKHSQAITDGATIVIGRKGSIGELNYSSTNCWPIDTTYFVDKSCTEADLRWLFHALAVLRMPEMNKAAAIPGLNRNDAYAKLLRLPPLPEQRRIAAILDKADALRAKRREAIAKLDQLLQSVFLDMFGDPVTNPKGWPVCEFGKALELTTGFPFKSAEFVGAGEGIKLCRGTNVLPGTLDWSDEANITAASAHHFEQFRLKPNDIVVAMDRPWISSGFKAHLMTPNDPPCFLVQRVARLRTKAPFTPRFVYAQIQSDYFRRHCKPTETTIPHISPNDFRSFPILSPPQTLIGRYESVAVKIAGQQLNLSEFAEKSDYLFATTQQKAFSGRL